MSKAPPPENRYSHISSEADLHTWWETFQQFDRDGGGDVDLRELGLMFRYLGQTPPESEMRDMIEAVDYDASGTIDYEEFCLLMQRQQRAAITPEWLRALFVPPAELDATEGEEEPPKAAAAAPLPPATVILRGKAHEQSSAGGKFGRNSKEYTSPEADSSLTGAALSRDLLLVCSDLLPNAKCTRTLNISGHGPMMGPFVASEIGRALHKSNRSVTSLDLSNNVIGDDGVEAVAAAVSVNPSLTSLHLSHNGIGGRGGTALLKALRAAPQPVAVASKVKAATCGLKEINIEGNQISVELTSAIQQQLLLNNLPRLFRESLTAAPPPVQPKRGKKAAPTHQTIHDSLQPGVVREAVDPAATISQAWLTEGHAAALLVELLGAAVACLVLRGCPRLGGAGVAALLAPMPPPSPLSKLVELRISNCEVDDVACTPLARAIHSGNMSAIRTLHLDHNRLTLGAQSLDAGAHIDLSEAAPESMAEVRQRDHAAPHTATVHAYSPPPCRLQSTSTTPHTAHLRNASHSALPCLAHRSSLHCPRAPLPACCRCSAPLSADSPT